MVNTHPLPQPPQNAHLHQRLLMKPLLVPDDLDRHDSPLFVVHTSHNLSETTLAKDVNHLIPIREMIAKNNIVITPLIIIAKVITPTRSALAIRPSARRLRTRRQRANDLTCRLVTREVDASLLVVDDFTSLEDVQTAASEKCPVVENLLCADRTAC